MTALKSNPSYTTGILNAVASGRAMAEDSTITEKDCPYKRWEHRKCWLDGFREVRNKQVSP